MTFARRLAVAAGATVLLAGCAVPGQPAAPGVLAEYEGRTLTTADVDAIVDAWAEDSDGAVTLDRTQAATYAVLGPDLLAGASELGYDITEGDGRTIATIWLQYAGIEDPEPSEEVAEIARAAAAAYILVASDQTLALVEDAIAPAEDGVYSPRLGTFDAQAFAESARTAHATAVSSGLEQIAYTQYLGASAFVETDESWAARG